MLSENGTPQGGIISPLLANIALHGLENYLILVIREERKEKRTKVCFLLIGLSLQWQMCR